MTVRQLTEAQFVELGELSAAKNYVAYYTRLASFGENYGLLALDVATAQGLSGRVARAFAEAVGREYGVARST